MEEIKLPGAVFAALINLSDQQKTEFLDELKATSTDDGDAVQSLVKRYLGVRLKSHGEQQYNRGRRTRGEELENVLTGALPEFSTDQKGKDFVSAWMDAYKKSVQTANGKPEELTVEQAKANPTVQTLIRDAVKQRDEQINALSATIQSNRNEKVDAESFRALSESARRARIALGDTPEAQTERLRTLHTIAKTVAKFDLDEKGNPVIRKKDGSDVFKDEVFNPVGWDQFVTRYVNKNGAIFPILTQDSSKSTPSLDNDKPGGNGKPSNYTFKDEADFDARWSNEPNRAKRREMAIAYRDQFEGK